MLEFVFLEHSIRPIYSDTVTYDLSALRNQLESEPFADLAEMMAAYARAAADVASRQFSEHLDFTSDSIDKLDEILVLISDDPNCEIDFEVRLWGGYLGEVLRRRYAGSWEMTQYPGSAMAVPTVEVRSSRLFPLMKVYRRMTMGEEEDLRGFYAMVTERLGKPAPVN